MRTLVSGSLELLGAPPVAVGRDAERATGSASRIAAKTLGESKRGQQYQSIVPSVPRARPCAGRRSGRARRSAGRGPRCRRAHRGRPLLDHTMSSAACAVLVGARAPARAFPCPPSSPAARARDARRTAADARRRPDGSCPHEAARAARGSPPEPIRVAGSSTHRKRSAKSARGKHLVAFAQLLDPVDEHPPAGREQAPERDGRGRRVPLDPPSPALAPVRDRGGVAEHDKPSAGPQRAKRAKRQRATEPVEHDVHTVAAVSSRTRARKSSLR